MYAFARYDRVYDGKMDCISLENIYQKFNIDHPADYKGRSLSVSDVVEIRESDTLNPGFYFVDSIGFKSISFDKSLCKEPVEAGSGKISVLLVEPNKYPKMIEIDDTLEAMQEVVGGDIEEYMPFEDEVAIICNEEGKVNEIVAVFRTVVYTDSPEAFKFYRFIDAESANEFDDFIAKSKELSFYDTGVTAEYGDKLITLSTCEYSRNNSRLVVVAKRITEDGGADAAKTHAEATAEGERPN